MRLPLLKPESRKLEKQYHGILLLLLVGLLFFVASVIWKETAPGNGSLPEVSVGPGSGGCDWDEIAKQWTWTKEQLQPCSGLSSALFDTYFALADADPNQWLSIYEIAMSCPIAMATEGEDVKVKPPDMAKSPAKKSGSARRLLASMKERRPSLLDFIPPVELLQAENPNIDPEFIEYFCRRAGLDRMHGYSYMEDRAPDEMSETERDYYEQFMMGFGEVPSVNFGQAPMAFDPVVPQVVATLEGRPACDSRKVSTTLACPKGSAEGAPCSPVLANAKCTVNQLVVLACECESGFIYNGLLREKRACIPCTRFEKPKHQCDILPYPSVCNDQWHCVWHAGTSKCIEFSDTANVRAAIDASPDTAVPSETLAHQNFRRWVAQGVFDHTDLNAYAFCGGGSAANTKWMGAFWGIFNGMRPRTGWRNLKEYLDGKVVGTNSGGGWLFSDLVYEPSASALFAGDSTPGDLAQWLEAKINSHYDALYTNQGWTWHKMTPRNDYSALDAAYGQTPHGWARFINAIHQSYGAAPVPQWDISGVEWYSITLMLTRGPFLMENGGKITSVATDIDLKQLKMSREWGGGTVIPVYLNFNSRNAYSLTNAAPNDGVQIPWMDNNEDIGDGMGHMANTCLLKMKFGKKVKDVPVAAIKKGIADSVQDPKLKSGPSSNAPGMMMAGASHAMKGAKQAMTLENFGWKATFPAAPSGDAELTGHGTVLVDGGALDNPGLAAAIRGLQKAGYQPNAEIRKIIVFLSGLNGNIRLYFGADPWGGGKPMPTPFPHIFDKWIQLGPWRVDRGVGNISIIPLLVRTRENKAWGIEANHYYRVVIVNVGPDLEALPQMEQKGRSRTIDYIHNSIRAAAAFTDVFATE